MNTNNDYDIIFDNNLEIFINEFNKLNKKISPEKEIRFISYDEKSEIINDYLLTGEEDFVVDYKGDVIEVKYNTTVLIQNYIKGSIYTLDELESLFKYFSRHEFGHTQLPKNFYGIEERKKIYNLLNTIKRKHIVSGYKGFLLIFMS